MFNVIEQTEITLTAKAADKVREIIQGQGEGNPGLRLWVTGGGCSGFKYGMALDEPAEGDEVFQVGDLRVMVDPMSLPYLKGCNVDYVDDAVLGQGFKVENPNAQSSCGCGQSFKA